jgi:hypothetical protein
MGEVDVDCGYTSPCPLCGTGAMCNTATDCESSVCTNGRCQEPTCTDGYPNGMESSNDCGGGTCPGCGPYQGCRTATDCAAGTQCVGSACRQRCDGNLALCAPCLIPTFTPCCQQGYCGCGLFGTCIL